MKSKGSTIKNTVAWIAATTLIVAGVIVYIIHSFIKLRSIAERFTSSMDAAMESQLLGFVMMQSVMVVLIAILGAFYCFILFRHIKNRYGDKQAIHNRLKYLEREKEFSQTIIDTSKAIIVGLDKDHIIQLFNEGAEKISGYKGAEVIGKDWFEIFFPLEMIEEMEQVWKKAWGKKAYSNVNPIRIKDGSARIISWQSSGMYNAENEKDYLLISIGEDITVRTEVESELRNSRNLNETLLNTMPDIIYIYDILAKKNVYSNNGIMTVLGYTVQEIKEMDEALIPTLMHPDDFKIYLAETVPRYHSIQDNEFIEHEFRMKHKSGEWHWLAAKESIYLRYEDGRAKQIFGVIRDITERKNAERKLHESKENLNQTLAIIESTLDSTVNGILVTDRDKNIIYTNNRFQEIWSIPDNVVAQGDDNSLLKYVIGQFTSPDDFLVSVNHLYENPELESTDKLELKDGRHIERYSIPHRLAGKVIGRVWSFRDITVEINTKQTIIEERNWLESVINSIPDPTLVVNEKREIQICNPAFTEVFGYTLNEVKGKSTGIVYPDQESFLKMGKERYNPKSESKKDRYLHYYKRKNGDIFPAETIGVSVRDDAGLTKGFVGIMRDITHDLERETEKKKLEEQLFQAQKMESIGRLAGGIAHDFNNILTSIMGYAELLCLKFSGVKSSENNAAGIILQGAVRASDLTKQLLGFARAGKFNPVPVDINNLIKEVVNVSEKIFEKKITVSYDLSENLSVVEADKGQLDQILTNLIINANDAMPEGGTLAFRTENVRLDESYTSRFSEFKSGNYVKISVTDSGIGMPREIREKIFEPFYTTKGEGKGTGLGLATVYGIVKNHEGHINVYSEPGEGTTFNLFLPASEKELVELEQETVNIMGNATILVVDDEEHVRNLAAGMLEQLGYKTLLAMNGKEAISIYLKNMNLIDLVVLDIIMPEMNGKETYLQLKTIEPEVKVVLTSGYAQNGKATDILSQGAAGFVQKPFRISELSKIIATVLA